MKKIDTSFVAGSEGLPFLGGSLLHIQQAYQEVVDAVCRQIIKGASGASFWRFFGAINTGSGANYVISAGSIYYNGEIYLCDAVNITLTGANVIVGTITTTYAGVDPTVFRSGASHSVHQIRKIVWTQALTGTADIDYLSVVNIEKRFEDVKFDATTYNPANSTDTTVYTFVAPCDMPANSLILKFMYRTAISGGGNAGTLNWSVFINATQYNLEATQNPTVYAGKDIFQTVMLVVTAAVKKGDSVFLKFSTNSASDPYLTLYNLNMEASCNKATNF